jgi:hypothetical protein
MALATRCVELPMPQNVTFKSARTSGGAPARERGREKRRQKRTLRRNAAWIVLSTGGGRIPCVLWDISEGGARLAAPRPHILPLVFSLVLSKDGRSRRYCRVVWRKDGHLGVRFIEESDFERLESRRQPVNVAEAQMSPEFDAITRGLVLPGCGPGAGSGRERRGFALSSIAFGLLVLLVTATALFAVAGMGGFEATWATQVCTQAENFCKHPEWTGIAGAVMAVVYMTAKGMEL